MTCVDDKDVVLQSLEWFINAPWHSVVTLGGEGHSRRWQLQLDFMSRVDSRRPWVRRICSKAETVTGHLTHGDKPDMVCSHAKHLFAVRTEVI
jgi:hypothetical protein